MWRATEHAVDTKAGHTRLTRPEGFPDELWWRFAGFLADHLNGVHHLKNKTCSNCCHSTPLADAGWNHKNSYGLLECGVNGFENANGEIDNFDWVYPNQTCEKHKSVRVA